MPAEALLFDVDGTLVDSVELHARAWQEAFDHFGKHIPFEAIRAQIGKGGDELMKALLGPEEMKRRGKKIDAYRSDLYKRKYLKAVRCFPRVCDLFQELRRRKVRIAHSSVRRLLWVTWNEWSASATTWSVARGSPSITGRSSASSARSSRVPCRKSTGTSTVARCSARSTPGLPTGCSGNPTNARPSTSASGASDCACQVIRPPIDLPPANSGSRSRAATATDSRMRSWSAGGRSMRRFPCSMYGNSYRSVATPSAASAPDNFSRKGWRMPAPAPCARTYRHHDSCGRRRITSASPRAARALPAGPDSARAPG